jgi:hypothetical protein
MINFCIDAEQLRKALKDIKAAEANGFNYCLAVFEVSAVGRMLDSCRAEYSDMIEKAHPTDGKLDWGRFQRVTQTNKFKGGKLVPIKGARRR